MNGEHAATPIEDAAAASAGARAGLRARKRGKRPLIYIGLSLALVVVLCVLHAYNLHAYRVAAEANNAAVTAFKESKEQLSELDKQVTAAQSAYEEVTSPAVDAAAKAPASLVATATNAPIVDASKLPRVPIKPAELDAKQPDALATTRDVQVTFVTVNEAQVARATAEQAALAAAKAVKADAKALTSFGKQDLELADSIVAAATEALANHGAWAKKYTNAKSKAQAASFAKTVKALEEALKAYVNEAEQEPDANAREGSVPLIIAQGDFVTAALALKDASAAK